MKKGRPGIVLSVQSRPVDAENLERILFVETPTLGVRRSAVTRTVLGRETCEVSTPWGLVAGKVAYLPREATRFTPEYEACHEIAASNHVALADVIAAARTAWLATQTGPDGRAI